MSLLRASSSLRRAAAAVPRRHLAIASTVGQATDTSKMDFPAPSHVSLSSQAAELASQLTNFYSDPDSVIKIPEETRKVIHADISKRIRSIPDTPLTEDWTDAHITVPSEVRLGDNPYFEAFKKAREAS
ncbi:unnamed protein product [Chondrus crispus]|uniref:Uncharacterized protein n=1 Tax=Chondrus crispus TaxID=2769 RepID=R7QGD0_CHOCR|nr:unnamed protein product [Chondrus crispus]CDF36486.1 unnamed protein product [Chondrus crispus]|eukprot:XP_005716305.1 unnamed protein product [Chondrus crispus]